MQPVHLLTDIPLVERHWGARGRGAYAFRSLRRSGTPVVFGSDAPVATLDPRAGIFAALERRVEAGAPAWRPDEALGFEDAVYAYTTAAARAGGVGARRGTLAPGMDADLVVWSAAPDGGPEDGSRFLGGEALLTVVDGEVVMGR
jgi:predicted amidohydrolase YtcJ